MKLNGFVRAIGLVVLVGAVVVGGLSLRSRPAPLTPEQIEWRREVQAHIPASLDLYNDAELIRYSNWLLMRLMQHTEYEGTPALVLILNDGLLDANEGNGGVLIQMPRSYLAACNSEDEFAGLLIWYYIWAGVERPLPPSMNRLPSGEPRQTMSEYQEEFVRVRRDVNSRAIAWGTEAGLDATAAATMCQHPLLDPNLRTGPEESLAFVMESWLTNVEEFTSLGEAAREEAGEATNTSRLDARFLRRIEGLEYGRSPLLGTFRDGTYLDAQVGLVMEFPDGFTSDGPSRRPFWNDMNVYPPMPGGRSILRELMDFDGPVESGNLQIDSVQNVENLDEYLEDQMRMQGRFFGEDHEWEITRRGTGESHGLPFEYVEISQDAELIHRMASVFAHYDMGHGIIVRLTIRSREEEATSPVWEGWMDILHGLRRMTDEDRASLLPRRIAIHEVAADEDITELATLMHSDWDAEMEFRLLNSLYPDGVVEPGQLVKIVVE